MKFDVQLASYLYENKLLTLEGIGTFTLDSKVSVPHEQEKEIYYPIEGLSFVYNPKSASDEEVILYLVNKLHKIQPLIRSDLESYLSNVRQFINIGKPYTIEGIGTLSKNNQGIIEFTPGSFLPVKEELHPKRENQEHNYPARSQSSAGRVFVVILVVIAAIAALGGIGWGVSSLLQNRQTVKDAIPQQGSADTIPPSADTDTTTTPAPLANVSPPTDSNTTIPASPATVKANDSANYKMVFEVTSSLERARKRTNQLKSYRTRSEYDSIISNDIVRYRLYVPVRIRRSDTSHIKDSLRVFLGSRVFIAR